MPFADWMKKYPGVARLMQQDDEVLEYTPRGLGGREEEERTEAPRPMFHGPRENEDELQRAVQTLERLAAQGTTATPAPNDQQGFYDNTIVGRFLRRIADTVPFVERLQTLSDGQSLHITLRLYCVHDFVFTKALDLRLIREHEDTALDLISREATYGVLQQQVEQWKAMKQPNMYIAQFKDGEMTCTKALPLDGTRPMERYEMALAPIGGIGRFLEESRMPEELSITARRLR